MEPTTTLSMKPRRLFYAGQDSREDILRAKNSADTALANAKSDLSAARRNAKARGIFLSEAEFKSLETRVSKLQRVSQILQIEASKARELEVAANRRRFEHHFIAICQEELDPADVSYFTEQATKRAAAEA